MNLLLDTHVWLWFVRGDAALPRVFGAAIRDPKNTVVLSIVSAWEVQVKTAIGKLQLGGPIGEFLDNAILHFEVLDIALRHVRALTKLPPHHRDPFDRMLVAQALADDLTLLTIDPRVQSYAVACLSAEA
jgi:PIN domain nuclease of toxin-antitoxin system